MCVANQSVVNSATRSRAPLLLEEMTRPRHHLDRRRVRLTAELLGVRGDPPHLVKAATYHRLALEPGGSGWRATVVLDV
jgi:SHS2 domain-containing protein